MKRIFNYIASAWNTFINLFKKKIMLPIESDIEDLIKTFISNNTNAFPNLIKLNYSVNTQFAQISTNTFEVVVKISTSFNTYLNTQLTFSNANKNYILDITDGGCNFKNSVSTHRNHVYTEVDFLNNRLCDKYETIFKKYHP